MKDEELRALERQVAASPTADGCLRLAREYERVGRHGDVPSVLRRGREHPEVRRALAALPVWDTAGGPGATSASSASPVADPRVLWTQQSSRARTSHGLIASGSIVGRVDSDARAVLLDGATGAPLWTVPDRVRSAWTLPMGEVLVLVHRNKLHGFSPRTGQALWELAVAPRSIVATCDGDALVVSTLQEIRLLRITDPSAAPIEVWRTELDRALAASRATHATAKCRGGLLVVQGATTPVVLDAATGVRRFATERRVVAVDEGGVITSEGPPPRLRALDPHGAPLPFHDGPAKLVALHPDVAVVRQYTKTFPHFAQPMLLAVDRRTGESRDLGVAALGSMGEAVVASDQLHLLCPRPGAPELSTIVALGLDGSRRWRLELDLPPSEAVDSLAVTSGRLFACTNRSTVVAIGDRTTA